MIDPINIRVAAEAWIKAYERGPRATVAATLLAVISFGLGVFLLNKAENEAKEAARLKAPDYQAQLRQLDETERHLGELQAFVETQKSSIRSTEDALIAMKQEKQRLEPILASDRATVEAIFSAQDERSRASVWRERVIGFCFGVLASLVASFIWYVGALLMQRRNGLQRVS